MRVNREGGVEGSSMCVLALYPNKKEVMDIYHIYEEMKIIL